MTSDLTSATSITLVSMSILHPTAILVASEAMATSKQPRRSHLTSELNSVTSITYVAMLLLPLTANSHPIFPAGQTPSIDLRGFAAGKNDENYDYDEKTQQDTKGCAHRCGYSAQEENQIASYYVGENGH